MKLMRYYPYLTSKYIAKNGRRVPLTKILTSPFLNFREKISVLVPNTKMLDKSYETMMGYDFRRDMQFNVPMLFIYGAEENICPSEILKASYNEIKAQSKQMIVIPKASHCCFFDQPEQFLDILCSYVHDMMSSSN